MIQEIVILEKGGESTLKKTQVSHPVIVDKKLTVKKVIGYFSLIPTSAIDLIGLIGHQQLKGIQIPTATKSTKKGFRMVAKW